MTLVICEECGKRISSLASSCPQCGFPRNSAHAMEPDAIGTPLTRDKPTKAIEGLQEVKNSSSSLTPLRALKGKRSTLTDRLVNAENSQSRKKYPWLLWALLACLPGICIATYTAYNSNGNTSKQSESQRHAHSAQGNEAPVDLAARRKRLDDAKEYLAKLNAAVPMIIQAQRQFDVDANSRLPMWQVGVFGEVGFQVLLAQPDDLNFGALRQGKKVAKIDRRRVGMKHTSDAGVERRQRMNTPTFISSSLRMQLMKRRKR